LSAVIRQHCDWPRFWWKDVDRFEGKGPLAPQLLSRDGDDLLGAEVVVLFIPDGQIDGDGDPAGRRITMYAPEVRWLYEGIRTISGWVVGEGSHSAEEELALRSVAQYAHRERWRWEAASAEDHPDDPLPPSRAEGPPR
jgi:hypothetical protein